MVAPQVQWRSMLGFGRRSQSAARVQCVWKPGNAPGSAVLQMFPSSGAHSRAEKHPRDIPGCLQIPRDIRVSILNLEFLEHDSIMEAVNHSVILNHALTQVVLNPVLLKTTGKIIPAVCSDQVKSQTQWYLLFKIIMHTGTGSVPECFVFYIIIIRSKIRGEPPIFRRRLA